MERSVRLEPDPDFDETARLANEAFETEAGFTPQRLRWLYDQAFSQGAQVLGLYADQRKVGQVTLLRQAVSTPAGAARAVALVDLFILKPFRSRDAISSLYGEVERMCVEQDIRFILAVPNAKAAGVNARYLKLEPFLRLDIRIGLALPRPGRRDVVSGHAAALGQEGLRRLVDGILPSGTTGLAWTAESLWPRLQDPDTRYGLHATRDLLLVSSRRTLRGLPHTLLCAFLSRPGAVVARRDVGTLTAAACRLHGRPLFVYAGVNAAVPLPGVSLPERLRPSPMVVQRRDFRPGAGAAGFDRFELLDFDFA